MNYLLIKKVLEARRAAKEAEPVEEAPVASSEAPEAVSAEEPTPEPMSEPEGPPAASEAVSAPTPEPVEEVAEAPEEPVEGETEEQPEEAHVEVEEASSQVIPFSEELHDSLNEVAEKEEAEPVEPTEYDSMAKHELWALVKERNLQEGLAYNSVRSEDLIALLLR